MNSEKIIELSVNALDNKKAENIIVLKVENLTSLASYFVISTATSNTHVRALADEVTEKLKENGVEINHLEGKSTGWLVLDYGDVIINIFTQKERDFYGLDRMWSDAEIIDTENYIKG